MKWSNDDWYHLADLAWRKSRDGDLEPLYELLKYGILYGIFLAECGDKLEGVDL